MLLRSARRRRQLACSLRDAVHEAAAQPVFIQLAADEDVLAAGFRPTTYAEHLLAVARAMLATGTPEQLRGENLASLPWLQSRFAQLRVSELKDTAHPRPDQAEDAQRAELNQQGGQGCADRAAPAKRNRASARGSDPASIIDSLHAPSKVSAAANCRRACRGR